MIIQDSQVVKMIKFVETSISTVLHIGVFISSYGPGESKESFIHSFS